MNSLKPEIRLLIGYAAASTVAETERPVTEADCSKVWTLQLAPPHFITHCVAKWGLLVLCHTESRRSLPLPGRSRRDRSEDLGAMLVTPVTTDSTRPTRRKHDYNIEKWRPVGRSVVALSVDRSVAVVAGGA